MSQRVRNISPDDLFVPAVGRVVKQHEAIEIPDAQAEGFLCQPATWEPVTTKKSTTKGKES